MTFIEVGHVNKSFEFSRLWATPPSKTNAIIRDNSLCAVFFSCQLQSKLWGLQAKTPTT